MKALGETTQRKQAKGFYAFLCFLLLSMQAFVPCEAKG
jgi:hypothetical protein